MFIHSFPIKEHKLNLVSFHEEHQSRHENPHRPETGPCGARRLTDRPSFVWIHVKVSFYSLTLSVPVSACQVNIEQKKRNSLAALQLADGEPKFPPIWQNLIVLCVSKLNKHKALCVFIQTARERERETVSVQTLTWRKSSSLLQVTWNRRHRDSYFRCFWFIFI